ncbi:EAL domain-containing response regulator [Methyloterricola oryzae]|uniref:EAL domain-containing response regulator n=1 Tax=Methyloterricola oryzae TaxID=1495050 RepID=UPI0005EBECBC|nr:EAL domain-containing protein [Methyloterricola oryzae]
MDTPPPDILIAEDDENSRELLVAALGSAGYAVRSAGNGYRALELARERTPDLIISDILMPKMDGYALCRALKQDAALAQVPVVFYTATYTEPRDQALAFSVGATRYLTKPMEMGRLMQALEDVLHDSSKGKTAGGTPAPREAFEAMHGERLQAKLSKKLEELEEKGRQLEESEQRFRDYAESVADWFWEADAHLRIVLAGGGPCGLTSTTLTDLLLRATDAGFSDETYVQALRDLNQRHAFRDLVVDFTDQQGHVLSLRLSGKPIFDHVGNFKGYRGVGRDVSETVSLNRRIEFLASHDELTGLPNRTLFRERLAQAIGQAQDDERVMVCAIDLDNFKLINDTLGHDAGDTLLKEAVTRITSCTRPGDTLARIAGDEFMLLMTGSDPLDAHLLAQDILRAFEAPVLLSERKVFASVSMGISVYPQDTSDALALLTYADMAMCRAKEKGRGACEYYTGELNSSAQEWLSIESGLRRALEHEELFMVYQPQVDLASEELVGLEALLRWRHPELGLIPPDRFIPVAERFGLIIPLTEWVLNTVCRQIQLWDGEGVQVPRVSVNISAHHIKNAGICEDLSRALTAYGITPQRLCVEITEHTLLESVESTHDSLDRLRSQGIPLSLDDFGLGYSSLGYLKRFPASELKIDRSFVDGVALQEDDRAICRAVIALGHAFGMRVVAEGIEDQWQQEALLQEGCDLAQGYLFARPMEDAQLREWLEGR